jgi:iron complex outermembrane receptor protein
MIPAGRLITQLRTNIAQKSKAFRNMYLLVEMDKTFDQERPFFGFNTETATRGYTLLNAGFGVDLSARSKTIASLHFSGNNLTDEAYQSHLSRLKYTAVNNATGRRGVYNMGRNFSIKLALPFSFRTDNNKPAVVQ